MQFVLSRWTGNWLVFSLALSQKIENEWGCIWGPWGDGVSLSSAGRRRGTYTVCPSPLYQSILGGVTQVHVPHRLWRDRSPLSRGIPGLCGWDSASRGGRGGDRLRLAAWELERRSLLFQRHPVRCTTGGWASLATPRGPSGGGTVLAGRLRCYSIP